MSAQPLPLPTEAQPQELYQRRACRNGRSIASFRAFDHGHVCVVEVLIGEPDATEAGEARAYRFGDAREATAFVSEAVEALMYLGCEIRAE
jgi:hypothetical protein